MANDNFENFFDELARLDGARDFEGLAKRHAQPAVFFYPDCRGAETRSVTMDAACTARALEEYHDRMSGYGVAGLRGHVIESDETRTPRSRVTVAWSLLDADGGVLLCTRTRYFLRQDEAGLCVEVTEQLTHLHAEGGATFIAIP